MPKITTPLTDTEIKKAKVQDKTYKLSDGQGLYFVIKNNGTRFFRFDYSFNKKRKSMSFGVYPETSLKEARLKRTDTRKLIKQGIDPIQEKHNQNDENLFKYVAVKWLDIMKDDWTNVTYVKAQKTLENNAYPFIGNKVMKDITRVDILDMLKVMEDRGVNELASRLLNYIERIYKYAVTYNIVEHNIVFDIDKKNVLKGHTKNNFPAITKESEIKQLMQDIENYQNMFRADISTVYALKLAPYVFVRPYNLRFALWSEIDLGKGTWDIPKNKMKTRQDFIIPLPSQAIKLLEEIKPYSFNQSEYVFPSPTTNKKPISDGTLNQALMRMGYKDKMTSHGFRAMFSTIAHEKIQEHGFYSDIIELCLAHAERNRTKAAYNRNNKMKYFDERKELLQWWANWITNPKTI